ncbi:hypothetical protein MNBD_GAMMA11-1410 [hydrothermal vent metagenome]|uniref:Uncharacterized protein n=1 Tax=hydrothermal vent metagenome TaxID=652676 RepID=A0A3B0X3Q1_9ZZZZ
MASQEVEKAIGCELAMGDVQFSVFPWRGFEVQQLALSNAPGFGVAHQKMQKC